MPNLATVLVALIAGAGAGIGGAFAYDEWIQDDDGGQRPIAQTTQQPSNANTGKGGRTPAEIYAMTERGVVRVSATITQRVESPFGEQEREGASTGTGFVVSADGVIVTNAHVVQGARTATITFGDDKAIPAEIKGLDLNSDLAVLKIDPKQHDFQVLELGSSKGLKVGDPVVAIGNPFGLDRTLTTGVVSALARRIPGLNGFEITDVIQTDAAINRGNSGGPLLDGDGKVIGVNSQIQSESGGNIGIGFAVPVETLRNVLPTLQAGKEVEVAFLGVTTVPVDEDLQRLGIRVKNGLLVAEVTPGSGAAKAGVKAGDSRATVQIDGQEVNLGGDIILAVDGKSFGSPRELAGYIASKKVGDTIELKVLRGNDEKTIKVELGNRPNAQAGG